MSGSAKKPDFDNVIAVPLHQQTSFIPAKTRRSGIIEWNSYTCFSQGLGLHCRFDARPILLISLLCCALLPSRTAAAAESVSAGPLFHEFALTLTEGRRTEALGPLFYSEQREKQRIWAIPPLVS